MTKDIAKTHKYWSRKPSNIIESYINLYSSCGEVVLDPFCGSGTTGIQALLNDRRFIGFDLNPIAIKICSSSFEFEFDRKIFTSEYEDLALFIDNNIKNLYLVDNDKYVLYSKKLPNQDLMKVVYCNFDYEKISENITEFNIMYGLMNNDKFEIPDAFFPKKFYKDRFSYKGISKVSDLFSNRNLHALSLLRKYIYKSNYKYERIFELALTNTLLHVSKLKSEGIRPLGVNNYWIPDDFIDENVGWRYLDRLQEVAKSQQHLADLAKINGIDSFGKYKLFNQTCIPLAEIDDQSVDYILTDPPYGDVIQYGELSFVWNTWLSQQMSFDDEIIVNPKRDQNLDYFMQKLRLFLMECERVLKEDRFITISFQNKDLTVWFKFAEMASELNFSLESVREFDFHGSTYNKNWSLKSPKLDVYLTLKKIRNHDRNYQDMSFHEFYEILNTDKDQPFSSRTEALNFITQKGLSLIFRGYSLKAVTKKELEVICNMLVTGSSIEDRQATLF